MKKIIWLIFILLVAAFFRLYQLDKVPPSPSLDEVSIGWNAYSLLKTGRDEYGYRWPLLLRAYDDYRPAGQVYLSLPLVALFGPTTLAVRLPTALLGLLTVLVTYFLVKELFYKDDSASFLALTASFLLAISPWHIYLSRLGHEVNAGLALTILGLLFFLKSVNRGQARPLFLAAIFFSLSFYTYQSQKIFTPLLILVLALVYWPKIVKLKKGVITAGLVGVVLLLPLLLVSFSSEGLIRFQATSIFNQPSELKDLASSRMTRHYQNNSFLGVIFDNQKMTAGKTFLINYFSHFDPRWLFFNQGRESHKVPSLGVLYLWKLPLILLGIYQLAKSRSDSKIKWLFLAWLLLAPLPAALTTQAPHAMRTFNALPLPQILAALGLAWLVSQIKNKSVRLLFFGGGAALILLSLFYLGQQYFVNFPIEQSDSFQYPLAQAINYVTEVETNYDQIIFSNQEHAYQSYMFFLFFQRYPPANYLAQGGTVSGGFAETHAFDKYEFRPIAWGQEKKTARVLYLGNVNDFPEGVNILKSFSLLDGQVALQAVTR